MIQTLGSDSPDTKQWAIHKGHYTVFLYSVLRSDRAFPPDIHVNRKRVSGLLAVVCMTAAFSACVQTGDGTSNAGVPPAMTSGKTGSQSDDNLAIAVRRALDKAPGFNVAGVFVRARDGAVILSGTVHSAEQIRQAEQIARTVPGVLVVVNKLTLWHGGNG
jgi:hyperosmotically inducible protein